MNHGFNTPSVLNPKAGDFLPTANVLCSRDKSGKTGSLNPLAINFVPLIDKSNIEYMEEVLPDQLHETPPHVTELRSTIIISNT